MNRVIYFIQFLFTFLVIYACAKPVAPNGGPKDTQAPKIIAEESEANFQTNFNKKRIKLKFDEFIQLQNPVKEILISPPTTYLPEFNTRTHTLEIKFDDREEFKQDATYQINFGDAIRDFNESNILKNYSFVFATGDKIDSLSVKGKVTDLVDGSDIQDMVIMLYDNLSDSIVYLEKPSYFAKTDGKGQFEIRNIRSDTFKVFGLLDNNLNYIYDNDNEKIAYLDSTIILNDSSSYDLRLEAYIEKTDQKILSIEGKTPGIISCNLQYPFEAIPFTLSNDSIEYTSCYRDDSLFVYYQPVPMDPFYMITGEDSLKVSPRKKDVGSIKAVGLRKEVSIHPEGKLTYTFSQCIIAMDTSLISIKDTSGIDINLNAHIDSIGQLIILGDFLDTTIYELMLLPEAVSSYLSSNMDTITQQVVTASPSDFGNIIMACDSLLVDDTYIFSLLKNEKVMDRRVIQNTSSDTLRFVNLPPGQYSMEIILDDNKDGSWTPGSYLKKTTAEKRINKTFEKLRQDWDLNVNFEINSLEAKQ